MKMSLSVISHICNFDYKILNNPFCINYAITEAIFKAKINQIKKGKI